MLFLCFLLLFSKRTPIFALSSIRYRRRVFANFTVGIFYAQGDTYSSDPRVESLMASQPDLGDEQRESGTFLFPSRVLVNILFHLIV